MIRLKTDRLLLRDWEDSDLPVFSAMNQDPAVMEYFTKPLTSDETAAMVARIRDEWTSCGYGLHAVETQDTGEFIGFIGFHGATFEADFTPCIEIGWRLKKESWGKGYATEGALACLHHGFKTLGFAEVFSFTSTINRKSVRVMEKIGLRFRKTFAHPLISEGDPLRPHVLYGLTKDEWQPSVPVVPDP